MGWIRTDRLEISVSLCVGCLRICRKPLSPTICDFAGWTCVRCGTPWVPQDPTDILEVTEGRPLREHRSLRIGTRSPIASSARHIHKDAIADAAPCFCEGNHPFRRSEVKAFGMVTGRSVAPSTISGYQFLHDVRIALGSLNIVRGT